MRKPHTGGVHCARAGKRATVESGRFSQVRTAALLLPAGALVTSCQEVRNTGLNRVVTDFVSIRVRGRSDRWPRCQTTEGVQEGVSGPGVVPRELLSN